MGAKRRQATVGSTRKGTLTTTCKALGGSRWERSVQQVRAPAPVSKDLCFPQYKPQSRRQAGTRHAVEACVSHRKQQFSRGPPASAVPSGLTAIGRVALRELKGTFASRMPPMRVSVAKAQDCTAAEQQALHSHKSPDTTNAQQSLPTVQPNPLVLPKGRATVRMAATDCSSRT